MGYDKIAYEELRVLTERSDIRMVLSDRRLRFIGHNLRHVEPITCRWMEKTLVTEDPG